MTLSELTALCQAAELIATAPVPPPGRQAAWFAFRRAIGPVEVRLLADVLAAVLAAQDSRTEQTAAAVHAAVAAAAEHLDNLEVPLWAPSNG